MVRSRRSTVTVAVTVGVGRHRCRSTESKKEKQKRERDRHPNRLSQTETWLHRWIICEDCKSTAQKGVAPVLDLVADTNALFANGDVAPVLDLAEASDETSGSVFPFVTVH
jgi:hypothetical protein